MFKGLNILIISNPGALSGGLKRSLKVLEEYSAMGVQASIVPSCPVTSETYKIHLDNYNRSSGKFNNNIQLLDQKYVFDFLRRNQLFLKVISKKFLVVLPYIFFHIKYSLYIYSIYKKYKFNFILNHHENLETMIMATVLGIKFHLPRYSLIQNPPYYADKLRYNQIVRAKVRVSGHRGQLRMMRLLLRNYALMILYSILFKLQSKIISVSKAPLIDIRAPESSKYVELVPGNAVEDHFPERVAKAEKVIHFARLTAVKGVFDALEVWHRLAEQVPDDEFVVAGRFFDEGERELFFRLKSKLRNVSFLGFLSSSELFPQLAASKCVINTSYEDAFSLAVLESLFSGTHVVAYDIPAMSYVFRDIKAVHKVPAGDIGAMSEKVLEVMRMPGQEYLEQIDEAKRMLEPFTSWRTVAETELREIMHS